jgi:putative molybdopterin biosynthesis protein
MEMLRQPPDAARELSCRLTRRVVSSVGNREFVRVQVGNVDGKWVTTPLGRGAGALTSLVKADGILVIPERTEGLGEGTTVSVKLRGNLAELAEKVVCIGSHDISLDLLSDAVRQEYPDFRLSSSHVGSLGGLMALRRGETHIAGTHLFDEATEQYNLPYLERLFPEGGITLINLVLRQQGLICRPELLAKISSLADVARLNLRFINRQRGAGTRVLTDYLLKQTGTLPSQLVGYDREETSHLNVAAAVAGQAADVGMGILAAAKAFDLAFVPLVMERYDLALRTESLEHKGVARLLRAITSDSFQQRVNQLGGYDASLAGQIFWGGTANA